KSVTAANACALGPLTITGGIIASNDVIVSNGNPTAAHFKVGAGYSSTGAAVGVSLITASGASNIRTSTTATGATSHALYYNPNGLVGSISTNATATAYNVSSDERLKQDIIGYDPQ